MSMASTRLVRSGPANGDGQLVPIFLGVLDSTIGFAFYFNINVETFYSVTLVLKLGIAAWSGMPSLAVLPRNLHFLAILFFGLLVSAFTGDLTAMATSQFFAFVLHLTF